MQLERFEQEVRKEESGIIIPKFKNHETDGGRFVSKIDDSEIYSTLGKVVSISSAARKQIDDLQIDLQEGDEVVVESHAKNSRNWFLLDRSSPNVDWTGLLLVSPQNIEGKITPE